VGSSRAAHAAREPRRGRYSLLGDGRGTGPVASRGSDRALASIARTPVSNGHVAGLSVTGIVVDGDGEKGRVTWSEQARRGCVG
jgi:hypothetical protein